MTSNNSYLILGIGNPGDDYKSTRHNAGIWLADAVAKKYNITFSEKIKLKAHLASKTIQNKKVIIAKSMTYMNESGYACIKISQFYKIIPENIIILHDELDIPIGHIRYKFAGGIAGHNGLRSIQAHLNTNKFHKIRIGIGRPENKAIKISSYVLQRPLSEELNQIENGINKVINNLELLINNDITTFQNIVHAN